MVHCLSGELRMTALGILLTIASLSQKGIPSPWLVRTMFAIRPFVFFALVFSCLLAFSSDLFGQTEEVYPGADELSPSRSEYFSWINNTNEGATDEQTRVNLDFFSWLHAEYGAVLDIYAFDAGAIDGKRFYGSMASERFQSQFPDGFGPLVEQAQGIGTRLGLWGGPDGFGSTPEEELARTEMMVGLCRELNFALFKLDAVCGPLRPEKEDAFIRMMKRCRQHCPDLIVLNHRLGLARAQRHATTFLWEGKETYIDVWSTNSSPAPHHRADALSRGLVPDLKRLTEDHGVCISSCLDFWEDDLVLQAFNRSLILSPQIYGNPWLLRDDEFPRLARLMNLHRKYREILVQGMELPEEQFGPSAVSRGDDTTRLVTLRNLTWNPVSVEIPVDGRIGLRASGQVRSLQLHPVERDLGDTEVGGVRTVVVDPFRASLLLFSTRRQEGVLVSGCDHEVIREVPGKSVLVDLLGLPGTTAAVTVERGSSSIERAVLDDRDLGPLVPGEAFRVRFPGEEMERPFHRKLGTLSPVPIPSFVEALYEATVFAADNNALEVRSLQRSGPSETPVVKAARRAFFDQRVFVERGIWDRNLFDGDLETGYFPSRKYGIDQRVQRGCFRLDLGEVVELDSIEITVPDSYSLQPLLEDEAYFLDFSTDLVRWSRTTFLAGKRIQIQPPPATRYLRFSAFPDRVTEIAGWKSGGLVDRGRWRASNLFAHSSRRKPVQVWSCRVSLDRWVPESKLCIPIYGRHGVEGAYAAARVDGQFVGCPDRAPSFPSNTWEYVNARRDSGYTYYVPVTQDMIAKPIEVFVISYDEKHANLAPEVWVTAYPTPVVRKRLVLHRSTDD